MVDRFRFGFGLALIVLAACDTPQAEEQVGEAADTLISPSSIVASAPSAGSLAVQWNCGVGLVAWIAASGTEIRGVRFDDEGTPLDASPILIAAIPSGFGASYLEMERAVDGFQVLVKTLGGFPIQRKGTAFFVGVDGAVGASNTLGGTTDSSSGFDPSAWDIVGTGFDGTSTFVATSSGTDPGASQPGPTMNVHVQKIGAGTIVSDPGIPGPLGTQKNAAFRGFGCGPAGCLLMTTVPNATGYDFVDRRLVNGSVAAVVSHPSTVVPNTGGGDVVASECGFLVLRPSSSRLVDDVPALLAGPVALTGSASPSTPYQAIADGADARIYWVEGGLQSIAIDADAQPGAPVVEDAGYAQSTLAIAPVGGGRGVQAFYEGGAVQVRFVGDSALVPTAGDCNTAPLPAITGATCPPSIGDDCTDDDECITGFCVDGVCCNTACDGECEACSIAAGAGADGTCGPATGPICDDGDACSQTSSCVAGVCTGSNPVADGTVCDDGSVCSDTSVCLAGACVVATPAPDGTSCPNLDPCSPSSECQAGVCVGVTACLPANDCQDAVCNAATGTCDQTLKPNGTPCAVDDLCSESFCNSGICESVPLNCGPAEACHELPACDPNTGACSAEPVADGTLCPGGVCLAGVCDTSTAQGGGPLGGGSEGGASQVGGSPAMGGDASVGGSADSPGGGNQGGAGDNESAGCDCTTTPQRNSHGQLALMLGLLALGRVSQSRARRSLEGAVRRRAD